MAVLPPATETGHFVRPFEPKRCSLLASSVSCAATANPSASHVGTNLAGRSRHVSPSSITSGSVLSNDENRDPSQRLNSPPHRQSANPVGGFGSFNVPRLSSSSSRSLVTADPFITESLDGSSSDEEASAPTYREKTEPDDLQSHAKWTHHHMREKPDSQQSTSSCWPPVPQNLGKHSVGRDHGLSLPQPYNFEKWPSDFQGRPSHDNCPHSDILEKELGGFALPSPERSAGSGLFNHSRQHSNVSSGFVHTIKTASLSNTTFSMLSRSLRLGSSSERHGHSSNQRYSIDSDRPATTSSVDEAALRRGIKRRQVIEEIIASEEGYVADLKALVFLYSTLLASASSLSNRVRSSVQQNVIELLHLHENLLDQLHRSSLNAARRKWFDTASPRRLGIDHRMRWRSLDSREHVWRSRNHRHTRSSIEVSNPLLASAVARAAEPIEAADLARMFKDLMPRFFAYEEYCAKHELMMHELYRGLPAWSEYGMGIESLAKSISALNHRDLDGRKALTVADLLMKPIQRICKYPLLLAELLKQTPVVDCPVAHAEIDTTLHYFREAVLEINLATDNPRAQEQIQRRWLLHERLNFSDATLQSSQFRMLGHVTHCGILHVAYQTKVQVDGSYALCLLFDSHFVMAMPARSTSKFDIIAVIHLSDLKLESSSDGKGLQCHTALYTWKLCFEADGQLYEVILSACSAAEEKAWKHGLRKSNAASNGQASSERHLFTAVGIDLRPSGVVFGQAGTLTRRLSIQRAATVGNRASVCQVIIRGTHNPQDLQDFRHPSSAISRSQSHLTTNRITVLAPKRSERARLEYGLAQVWTRDTVPFPGMTSSRGGQIIRASAGSLVRKLSLASIHTPFGRRSASLTLHNRKSSEAFREMRSETAPMPVFQVKKDSHEVEDTVMQEADLDSEEGGACDVEEEKGLPVQRVASETSKRLSFTSSEALLRGATERNRRGSRGRIGLGPEDPAKKFYSVSASVVKVGTQDEFNAVVEEKLRSRKRWSNPMGLLKGLTGEGIRHMLYSSNHK